MKLTKIISVVLVFSMMLTVLGSFGVFAAETAQLSYKVYSTDGTEVTGNLEAGNTYEVALVFSDIPSKSFKGADVKTTFDPAVLQLVKANGDAAATVAQAVIATAPMYDEDEGTGYFSTAVCTMNQSEGFIQYNISLTTKDGGAILEANPEGLANEGTFEFCRIRFKALKDGATKIATTNEDVKFYPTSAKEDVSIVAPSIRVGEVAYVSATADADFAAAKTYVVSKTDAETILADLAKDYATVNVTYVDEEDGELSKDAAIVWAADKAFDADKAGEYKFVGTVTTPEGVNYKGEAVTVEATITIDTLKVQSVDAIDDIVVRVGDTVTLPSVVGVVVTGDEVAELAVTWTPATVDTTAAGTFDFVGAITGTDNIDANEKTAAVKVIVLAASEDKAPAAVDAVEVNAAIDADDIAADAAAALPEFVTVGTDTKTFINVTWEQVTEAPEEGFQLGDIIEFKPVAEGVTFPEDYVAKVTVAVPAGKDEVIFEATEFETEVTINDLYTLEKAIEDAAFAGEYADGTEIDLSEIVWDKDGAEFDAQTAGTYTLVGTWSDIYGNEQTFTITIEVVNVGATAIGIYRSEAAANPITSLNLEIGESVKLYHRFTPVDAIDTVSWSSNKNIVDFKIDLNNPAYITLRAKNAGTCEVYATTSQGIKATIKVVVNASVGNGSSNVSGPSAYNNNPAIGQLLAGAAEELEQQKVVEASSFTDLGGYEWAATQIETLRLLSIVSGKTKTTFAPADSVTRAEFLAMLVRLFGFKANGEVKTFTDVPADAWFYDTVSIASSLGIAYGYENGAFDPNAVITRQDMAVFAARAVSVAGLNPERGIERAFNDQAEIADYAKNAVSEMSVLGVINGMNDGNFCPADTANRAQAAVVVYNLYAIKNK